MALNLPTFYKRTGSAIVFAIIMLGGLLTTSWAFLVLVCLIEFLCFREYVLIMKKIYPEAHWPRGLFIAFSLIGVLLPVVAYVFTHAEDFGGNSIFGQLSVVVNALLLGVLPLIVLPVTLLLVALLSKRDFLLSSALSVIGILYITLPVIFLLFLRNENMRIPVTLIVLIWINDTMQYLVGSFIGKTPFSPISPKKTWEGTLGGSILTLATAAIYAYLTKNHIADYVAIALCVGVAGTMGDLLESKLKRLAGVKDSGAIMPGHGGALDRFDSLLVATPFAFAYVACFSFM